MKNIFKYHESHLSEIIKGSAVAFVLKGVGAVAAFILNVIVARNLGASEAGIFFLTATVIFVVSTLGRLGLDNAVIRFISSFASEGNWDRIRGVYRLSLSLGILGTGFLSIVIYFGSGWISENIFSKPDLAEPLKWMSIRIVPLAVLTLIAESLKGLKRIALSQVIHNLSLPLVALFLLLIFPAYHSVHDLVWIWNAAAIFVMLASIIIWNRSLKDQPRYSVPFPAGVLTKSAVPLFFVTTMNLIIMWSSTLVLGIFSDSADVGVFNLATRTANLMNFLLVSVNTIAAPKFAELWHNRDFTALKKTAQDSTRLMFWLSLPVFLGVVFFSSRIMGIFGDQFVRGAPILAILTAAQFINVSTGSVGYLLMMSANEKLLRNNTFVVAILNVILNLVLIPEYGIYGAVVASSLSLVLQNIISLVMVRMKLKFWTIPLFENFARRKNA